MITGITNNVVTLKIFGSLNLACLKHVTLMLGLGSITKIAFLDLHFRGFCRVKTTDRPKLSIICTKVLYEFYGWINAALS